MYAATNDKTMEYIIWEGSTASYPDWYYRYVFDDILEDEFRYFHYVMKDDTVIELVESVAVFLLNKRNEVKLLELDQLDTMCMRLTSRHCAFIEDCFLYYIYEGRSGVIPEWFMEQVEYGIVARQYGEWVYYDNRGEIAMSPSCVFLWNERTDMHYMETEDFKDICIYKRY